MFIVDCKAQNYYILSLCSGPDQEDYKIQYKRHCIIIEELLEAGAQDDDLAQPFLPDIPDKCAQVNIFFLIILILIRSAEMVQLRIARTRITAMIGVRRHRRKKNTNFSVFYDGILLNWIKPLPPLVKISKENAHFL